MLSFHGTTPARKEKFQPSNRSARLPHGGFMRKLRIAVIDLVGNAPTSRLFARMMNGNQASIMPQAIASWCEQEGHDVHFVCYSGRGSVLDDLSTSVDLVFVSAFTRSGQLAYAISNFLHSRGVVTVLGGPHARSYPEDACKYFDYVVGFTDRQVIRDILQDCSHHRPLGMHLTATRQPMELPGVRERWKFIHLVLEKVPFIKIVPMVGSLGCPYTCSFCVDAAVPHQPLSVDALKEDLRFLLQKFKRPRVGWHDPNFGIRFNESLDAIEEAVPPGSIDFFAESSLSILSEQNVKRLKRNGFKAVLPGIESWYDMGNKSKTGRNKGMEKVRGVADHVNMILEYVPYVQTNFVLGLDTDRGSEPFELTKHFIDLAPGAYPALSFVTAFGEAAPLNLEYQRAGRVLGFPFHFLNCNHVMNVRLNNYTLPEFVDLVIDLRSYVFAPRVIARRVRAAKNTPKWLRGINAWRSVSSEFGKVKNHVRLRERLSTDPHVRRYWEGETTEIPSFYVDWVKRDLGLLWEWLPEGALYHDPNAYLNGKTSAKDDVTATTA
jgi:hypothetical protein